MLRSFSWIDEPLVRGAMAFNAIHKRSIRPWGLHSHVDYWEAFCLLSGSLRHRDQGGEQIIEEGGLVFLGTDCPHDGIPIGQEGCTFVHISFPAEAGRRMLQAQDEPDLWPWQDGGSSPVYHVSLARRRELVRLLEDLDPKTALDRDLLILALLREARLAMSQQAQDLPPWLMAAMERFSDERNWEARPADIARWCGRSVAHCNRIMRLHRGVTLSEALSSARLAEAARRLRLSDERVVDISLAVGFGNLSHFHRSFKKKFGSTPRQYRQRVWRDQVPG